MKKILILFIGLILFSAIVSADSPLVSDLSSFTSNQSVYINFSIDVEANATINYGTTTSLGTEVANSTLSTLYAFNITGLANNTLYYYNITACNATACSVYGVYNFTTNRTHVLRIFNFTPYSYVGSYIPPSDGVVSLTFNYVNSSPISTMKIYTYCANGSYSDYSMGVSIFSSTQASGYWNSSYSYCLGDQFLDLFINDTAGNFILYKGIFGLAKGGLIPLSYQNTSLSSVGNNIFVDASSLNVTVNITTRSDVSDTYINIIRFNNNSFVNLSDQSFVKSYKFETGVELANDSMDLSYAVVSINLSSLSVYDVSNVVPYFWNESASNWSEVSNYSIVDGVVVMNLTHFSVYGLFEGGEIYNLSFVNITSSFVSSLLNTNKTILLNLTNEDAVSREYNFSIETPFNASAWLNNSVLLNNINFSAGETKTLNLTINANSTGIYNFNIIATLSTNATVILNSSQDLNITLEIKEIYTLILQNGIIRWGVPNESSYVISGNKYQWNWQFYTPGSGRLIPNGTKTRWDWTYE